MRSLCARVRQDLLDEVVWTEVLRLLEEPALIQQELGRRLAAAQGTTAGGGWRHPCGAAGRRRLRHASAGGVRYDFAGDPRRDRLQSAQTRRCRLAAGSGASGTVVCKLQVMALTNAERQRRHRERHPEKAEKRFEDFKANKAAPAFECPHGVSGLIEIDAWFCCACQEVFYFREHQETLRGAMAEGKRDELKIVHECRPRCSPFAHRH